MASGQDLVSGKQHEQNSVWSSVVKASGGSFHGVDTGHWLHEDGGGGRVVSAQVVP